MSYVAEVSPFNPEMKFSPGNNFGRPLSPRSLPYWLMWRIAVFNWLVSQFNQFSS